MAACAICMNVLAIRASLKETHIMKPLHPQLGLQPSDAGHNVLTAVIYLLAL